MEFDATGRKFARGIVFTWTKRGPSKQAWTKQVAWTKRRGTRMLRCVFTWTCFRAIWCVHVSPSGTQLNNSTMRVWVSRKKK